MRAVPGRSGTARARRGPQTHFSAAGQASPAPTVRGHTFFHPIRVTGLIELRAERLAAASAPRPHLVSCQNTEQFATTRSRTECGTHLAKFGNRSCRAWTTAAPRPEVTAVAPTCERNRSCLRRLEQPKLPATAVTPNVRKQPGFPARRHPRLLQRPAATAVSRPVATAVAPTAWGKCGCACSSW
jgi:hypothetical protein